jgi:hypothetical protein
MVAKTYHSRAQVKVKFDCVDSIVYCLLIVVSIVFKFLPTGWAGISSKQ